MDVDVDVCAYMRTHVTDSRLYEINVRHIGNCFASALQSYKGLTETQPSSILPLVSFPPPSLFEINNNENKDH